MEADIKVATCKQISMIYPFVTLNMLRNLLRERKVNGLQSCILNFSKRKIYFDLEKFDRFIKKAKKLN